MYVGRQKDTPKIKQFIIGLIIFLLGWILISSIMDRSPTRLLADGWHTVLGTSSDEWNTYGQLKEENIQKDSIIDELQLAIDMMKKSRNFRQAVVAVETENLNMRSKPVLGADVILQLPVGSVVEVLYFDDETFRIGGEYGKWCKIRYAEKEGWVWGNYINILK